MLFAIAGCSDRPRGLSTHDTALGQTSLNDTIFAPHEHDTIDAPRGVWTVDAIVGALERRGLGHVQRKGTIRQPFLGPAGALLEIPGAEIQVYLYADALARARETDLIDSLKVAPRRTHVDWRMPASIIVINNAALIVLTNDENLRKRIHAAVRLHD